MNQKNLMETIDLIALGNAVKFVGDYEVSGDLVLYSSASDPDLSGQFFTKNTDFGKRVDSPIYYHHGLNPYVGKSVIGDVSIQHKSGRTFVQGELDKRNKYVAEIMRLRDSMDSKGEGVLGWSSGTLSHLVEVKSIENSDGVKVAEEILMWPLGLDASLTPTPCEPRTAAKQFIGHANPVKTWQLSLKDLLPTQTTEFDIDEPTADPSKQPFNYEREPHLGHVMASKLSTEYNRITSNLIGQYAIGVNDYREANRKFGNGLARFYDSMDDGLRSRKVGTWDAEDVHIKSGEHMVTVGDTYHAVLTRAYNSGADHLLSRGHITGDEHAALAGMFENHVMGHMKTMGCHDRKLSECGNPYLNLKTISGDAGLGSQTVADETGSALGAAQETIARFERLKTRYESIKVSRENSGDIIGQKLIGHIDDACAELLALHAHLKSLLPEEDPDMKALREALAS